MVTNITTTVLVAGISASAIIGLSIGIYIPRQTPDWCRVMYDEQKSAMEKRQAANQDAVSDFDDWAKRQGQLPDLKNAITIDKPK